MARGRAKVAPDNAGERSGLGTDRQFVTAIARGFKILSAFKGPKPLGNLDIAQFTGLPRPTVSRLTYTLTRLGYLRHIQDLSQYALGPAMLSLGFAALRSMEIRRMAKPYMQELSQRCNVNVILAIPEQCSMLSIESCDGNGLIGLKIPVGYRVPMATAAVGRAYIAGERPAERAKILSQLQSDAGGHWSMARKGIDKAIRDFQTRGYCESFGDWNPDVNSIGAPICGAEGSGVFGMSVGAPAFLMPPKKLQQEVAPHLLAMTAAILKELGVTGPTL